MTGQTFSMGGQISGNSNAPAAEAGGALIKDASAQSFVADVIETSRTTPVLVDFWAPWCGPCKQLTPVIERVVREAGGKIKLVKVNIDENQGLAGQMRVQSVPAVFAFVNGQPVDAFMGAKPESEVRAFVAKVTAMAGPGAEIKAALEAAAQAYAAEQFTDAGQIYAQVIQADRENAAALAGLIKCQIALDDLDGARTTLGLVAPSLETNVDIMSARAALELAETPVDDEAISTARAALEKDQGDHQARLDLAIALNAAGEREQATDELITILAAKRDWNDGAAKAQLLKFFEAWGMMDEATVAGRRKMSTILFS